MTVVGKVLDAPLRFCAHAETPPPAVKAVTRRSLKKGMNRPIIILGADRYLEPS
jgi:hypothetical protein